jgi:hypothetical protein
MSHFDAILSRRDYLKLAVSVSMSGWLGNLARAAATDPARKRSCILLWMSGGPATIDLFDPKPGHANGGPTKEIDTAVPGLKIGEYLPKVAGHMDRLAILRGMSTKEADHGRATLIMRTGVMPQGAIEFPTIGSLVAKELATPGAELPPFVSIAPQRGVAQNAFSSGFLGPQYAPLIVADGAGGGGDGNAADQLLKVQDLDRAAGVSSAAADARLGLMRELEAGFVAARPGLTEHSHRTAYDAAVRMMKPETARAFDLTGEPAKLRDSYGRNLFGQGCLLARRLVERGVPFVEVTLSSAQAGNQFATWDSHADNFNMVKTMCGVLDPAWSTLMADLRDRGLLDSTMVVWMGEFGRTPKIVRGNGRDHFATAWATVLGGGGIKGGQAVGKTSKSGADVEDRPVAVADFLATVVKGLGIDPDKQNMSNVNRPIRIADKSAKPVTEVLA